MYNTYKSVNKTNIYFCQKNKTETKSKSGAKMIKWDVALNTHNPQIHSWGPEQKRVQNLKLQCHQLINADVLYHELVISSVIIIQKGSKRLSALQLLICISTMLCRYGPD